MVDRSLPEPSDEFLSMRQEKYPKALEIIMKNFKGRLRLARTLGALQTVRRDIEQSGAQQNFSAKEALRVVANERARELGFKGKGEGGNWWN